MQEELNGICGICVSNLQCEKYFFLQRAGNMNKSICCNYSYFSISIDLGVAHFSLYSIVNVRYPDAHIH